MSVMPAAGPGTDRAAAVNGFQMHYREQGDQAGPGVLMLHGIMGHRREWDPLTTPLGADGFRVIAADQRGHGHSDHTGRYTTAAMASDAAALIETLALAPVRLVGHSMGALAALRCAADRPDLVDQLVLMDIGPDSLTTPWAVQELPAMLHAFGQASYATADQAVAEWLSGDPLAQEAPLRHYVEHCLEPDTDGRLRWRFDADGLARDVGGLTTPQEIWDALARVTAPTLLVRGQYSPLLSAATAAEMVRRLADGRLVEIPDAGHDLGVEQPEAVTAAVSLFLKTGTR